MGPISRIFNARRRFDPVLKRSRTSRSPLAGACLGGAIALALSACAPTVNNRGHLPAAERLAEIHPGQTTKDQVVQILGTPSSSGVFDDKTWYYISRRTEQVAFFDKDVLDQQVYVIDFDNQGVVKKVDHKDLKDARLIEPAPGATPAPGRELTFIEQIIGNVGRFSGGAISATGGGEGAGR
jgi:outer membrane protein assembly factor BamE (lipoprotein component of BamABCDE complex)